MQTSLELSKHLNNVRHLYNNQNKVPDMVYHIYKKKYQPPSLNEGFDEIINIPFIFDDNLLKDIYWLKAFKTYSE